MRAPGQAQRHPRARLGRWYGSEAAAPYRSNPAFVAMDAPHMRLHALGHRIEEAWSTGRRAEATALLDELEGCSMRIVASLEALQRELVPSP